MPTLGVVIPTKNSIAYLPRHMKGLHSWLDLAAEVVVVDSFSTDGTVEYLRAQLTHPRVNFVSHPPGLYTSWNHGIAHVSSKYVYIATTGDVITRDGITHLVATAEALKCDVVVSKPNFEDSNGKMLPDIAWPVDDIIASLGVTTPRRLHNLEAMIFAAAHVTGALTGSCASCVFRTEVLKRLAFPTEFGGAGDGAWGIIHAAELKWAVTPERFSRFLIHPPNMSDVDKRNYTHSCRMDAVLHEAAVRWLHEGTVTAAELERIHWSELERTVTEHMDAKIAFDQRRHACWPWSLNPAAWAARARRQNASTRMTELKCAALKAAQRQDDAF